MTDVAGHVHNVVVDEAGPERAGVGFSGNLTADHGVDDLDLMKIAMSLEQVFGAEVSDDALQQQRTVAHCADLVCDALERAQDFRRS